MRAIGMMSGTSLDGIDVAFVETDGETELALGPGLTLPYSDEDRALLRRALGEAAGLSDRRARGGVLAEAEARLTQAHVEALSRLCAEAGIAPSGIDVVGFHGQTVLHRPEKRLTVQIGDGARLAQATGLDVVHDFRAEDVAAGGQGAPLVPVFHRALALSAGLPLPVVVINLGGVANVTYIAQDALIAFDTGPANALVDDWVASRTGARMDEGGRLAAAGRVDEATLAHLLDNPFFAAPPPKSLDREDFAGSLPEHLSIEDGAATLTAFTAASLALARRHLPVAPTTWIASGGGARNPTLLAMLSERLDAPLATADSLGWSGDHIEAQAFAYMAVRSRRGLPLTFPGTTGVAQPMTGGVLARPRAA